jgi:hypothetical protein
MTALFDNYFFFKILADIYRGIGKENNHIPDQEWVLC